MTITYRNTLPKSKTDLIVVALIHQNKNMVLYMIKNLMKYLKGDFMFFIHYNGSEDINENDLPEWVWLNRNPLNTERYQRSLAMAAVYTLKWALEHTESINVMTLSSGSAFFREMEVPKTPRIFCESHETVFNPTKNQMHLSPMPVELTGRIAEYLVNNNAMGPWQYKGSDFDHDFHDLVRDRKFTHYFGCQFSGQVWPLELAKMIVEDLSQLIYSSHGYYACEEIYFATYAYNYSIRNNIPIERVVTIINWEFSYMVQSLDYINRLRNDHPANIGFAVCKLSDDINDPVRKYLLM